MAEAVHHRGRQQHADDAQEGDDGEDQILGGLGPAVLGEDLVELVPLQERRWMGVRTLEDRPLSSTTPDLLISSLLMSLTTFLIKSVNHHISLLFCSQRHKYASDCTRCTG